MLTINDIQNYDFLDLGCKTGASIRTASLTFGGKGIGVDIDAPKVAACNKNGWDAFVHDIQHIDEFPDKCTKYVISHHVMEHMCVDNNFSVPQNKEANLAIIKNVISHSIRIAKNFVYFIVPNFDDDTFLAEYNLKQYWSQWHGHPTKITTADVHKILKELGISEYAICHKHTKDKIVDSSNATIVPLTAPIDCGIYDPKTMGEKPFVKFPYVIPIETEVRIKVDIPDNDSSLNWKFFTDIDMNYCVPVYANGTWKLIS